VLVQVAQSGCGCPIPGGAQDQNGWGHGQPALETDLVAGGAHGRGLELDDL